MAAAVPLPVIPAVQKYDWGRRGERSAVARLFAGCGLPGAAVDAAAPYAELWMGTHPNGEAHVAGPDGRPLRSVKQQLGGDLDFLLKVLSVDKALSIQAHPDQTLAAQLHRARPDLYKDAQHKPEMALAVTDFEAMCGFRPAKQIAVFLRGVPELRALVGDGAAAAFERAAETGVGVEAALRDVFGRVMRADKAAVAGELRKLLARLAAGERLPQPAEEKGYSFLDLNELLPRLNAQYPDDVGVFAALLLNCFRLRPGEAIFLGPNLPHAYLDGDCIECMACSDNVVRAGLTPKFRDVDTLCAMLHYEASLATIIRGAAVDAHTRLFAPPVKEFQLLRTELPPRAHYSLQPLAGPSLAIVYQGSGAAGGGALPLRAGSVFLIPARAAVAIEAGPDGLLCFRCSASETHAAAL